MTEWYNKTMEIEVPAFINHIKNKIGEKNLLLEERNELTERIKKGSKIISELNLDDRVTLEKAVDLIKEINMRIDEISKEIQDIEVEITAIFESKLSDLGFVIKLPKDTNDLNMEVKSREIYCVPWSSAFPDKTVMTPEDIWFFGMAKKLFNVKGNNIEFISQDIFR